MKSDQAFEHILPYVDLSLCVLLSSAESIAKRVFVVFNFGSKLIRSKLIRRHDSGPQATFGFDRQTPVTVDCK